MRAAARSERGGDVDFSLNSPAVKKPYVPDIHYSDLKDITEAVARSEEDVTKGAALVRASEEGKLAAVEALLGDGAAINYRRINDEATPLYIASQNGHVEVVKALLAAGADFNQPNKDGVTPFTAASQNGHLKVVAELLDAEAGGELAFDV